MWARWLENSCACGVSILSLLNNYLLKEQPSCHAQWQWTSFQFPPSPMWVIDNSALSSCAPEEVWLYNWACPSRQNVIVLYIMITGDSEVQRTMLELLNQLDGFEPKQNIKVCHLEFLLISTFNLCVACLPSLIRVLTSESNVLY